MQVTFLGAAQNVTGSKHLIQTDGFNLLLDCGLYQGKRSEANRLNRNLPFDASKINAVIISHAHTDHTGMLPLLVKNGFTGNIYCTGATMDIVRYILLDNAAIQAQDAEYMNTHLAAGEQPIVPMYSQDDVERTMAYFKPVPYFRLSGQWTELNENIRFKFYDAGHILGSAVTFLEIKENGSIKTLAFTGDLGKGGAPILHTPEYIREKTDILLMESTYGDKNHKPLSDAAIQLKEVIADAVAKQGKIIVPAFALGRTQELIYILHELTDSGQIPRIPIFIDSPLGMNITEVFLKHGEDYNDQTRKDFTDRKELPFIFRNLQYVRSIEESKALNNMNGPLMVIASSGMAEGGRILHHLKNGITCPENTVLITGYQAEQTLGRKIQEGISPVKIFGNYYDVRARVIVLDEFSAHADQNALLDYVGHTQGLQDIFLVHTELPQAQAFKQKIAGIYPAINVNIPGLADAYTF